MLDDDGEEGRLDRIIRANQFPIENRREVAPQARNQNHISITGSGNMVSIVAARMRDFSWREELEARIRARVCELALDVEGFFSLASRELGRYIDSLSSLSERDLGRVQAMLARLKRPPREK